MSRDPIPTAASLRIDVLGLGLLGPGLADWASGAAALADRAAWTPAPTVIPPPARLPPAERRRAGAIVKLALTVADQACAASGLDPAGLPTVFTAASGDGANLHAMCEVLATPERLVSPTRFTNSVHNAAAGYWHIAVASRAPSTSLSAHDAGFGAGLLEAASQCAALGRPVLFVAADTPYPEPLHGVRALPDAFGVAMVLAPAGVDLAATSPGARAPLATLALALDRAAPPACDDPRAEALRRTIPAARALPLLQAVAQGAVDRPVVVEYLPGVSIAVTVTTPSELASTASDAA